MNTKETFAKSKKGFKWAAVSSIVKGGVGFATISILTLVLGPERIGIVSILAVIYGLSETLVEFGISQSIISRKKTTNNELSSIFWVNQAIGVAVFLTIFLVSGLVANFYKHPELSTYIKLLSFIFIIEPLDLIFEAVLQKEINFPVIEKVGMVKSVAIFISTVVCLYLGFAIYSYLVGVLVGAVVDASLFSVYFIRNKRWFPGFHFRLSEVKEHYSFGFFVTARTFLNYAGYHVDELVIGKLLGVYNLGIYYFAKNLIGKITQFVSTAFNKILFPLFSNIKSDVEKLKKTYLSMTSRVFSISFIFVIGAFITPVIIPLIWGEKWMQAIFLVQVFCVNGLLQVTTNGFNPPVLYAFERPDRVLLIDIIITPIRLVLITISAFFSIEVVGVVLVLSVTLKKLLLQHEVNKLLKINFVDYLGSMTLPAENMLISVLLTIFSLITNCYLGLDKFRILSTILLVGSYAYLFLKKDRANSDFMLKEIKTVLNIRR